MFALKRVLLIILFSIICLKTNSQAIGIGLGTDIPYQFYGGVNLEYKKLIIPLKSGYLTKPYSNSIVTILNNFGTDDRYLELLDNSFEKGWMNSIGLGTYVNKNKTFYFLIEYRLDRFKASNTSLNIISAILGQNLNFFGINQDLLNVKLGLNTKALGLRIGKKFKIDKFNSINLELSGYKFTDSQTRLEFNNIYSGTLNKILHDRIWQDALKEYGYLGGIGVSYIFCLN